jgi:rRNA-processing protein CGR1
MVRPIALTSVTSLLMKHVGKQWHETKKAFRPTSGLTSYTRRQEERTAKDAMKAKEKEMKDEKEATRQVRCSR